ncbi:hypothetical protein GLOIN_2v1476190 [Rhizophagus irregularis DAOM 181602=DAOM 197198]|nr:hypothetical protein GLOIN_2v1476190 [Rhizophagus irregularis DAOM 181602=DAOM 197198]
MLFLHHIFSPPSFSVIPLRPPYPTYKMALVRQLKSQKVACHQSNVSLYLWAEEPEDVKNTYQKLSYSQIGSCFFHRADIFLLSYK